MQTDFENGSGTQMQNPESCAQFYNQIFGGAWMTQGLSVVAELGIADILATGGESVGELARRTGANEAALYRVMRALASIGVFAEDGAGRFQLTEMADLLRSNVAGSQRARAMIMGAELHGVWGELLHSVKTGEEGFQKRYGKPFFEYMTCNPDRHAVYDKAMNDVHGPETAQMLDAYDFSQFGTVADIGGGNGQTLATILQRHGDLRGILFDLPDVVDRVRARIAGSDIGARCQIVGGDFFAGIPVSADAYILRHIIHDWNDDDAVSILCNCRDSMQHGSRILVVETVLPPGNEPSFGKWLDLMMLLVGGRERTGEEYARLFAAAGLKLARVIPAGPEVSLLEAAPA